jgi:hypothetical protein
MGPAVACLAMLALGCVSRGGPTGLYVMPAEPALAIHPADADPDSAAELAEGALHLLDPARPGGPDYMAAARMCLLAIEVADPDVERDLVRACYRVAARCALRSGDRETYLNVVERWDRTASRNERAAGELAIHLTIRNRLEERAIASVHIPPDVRRLVPPLEPSP